MKNVFYIVLIVIAQTFAWFQSNSGIIGGWFQQNYIAIAVILGSFVSLLFALITKSMYDLGWTLWSIRFICFGIGYAVFIPLTWYYLGEQVFTFKNIASIILCVLLIYIQMALD